MAMAKVDSLSALISAGHHSAVRRNESLLDSIALFLKASFLRRIESAEAELRFTEMRISTTDPRNAISAGKSLVADAKGVRFSSVKERRPGDSISVWMEDGKLDCLVQKVSLSGDGEDENTGTMTA
jgi:exonuclease VII large subunit